MNSDVDKVMLARLDSLATAGFVAAAFRLMLGILLPVRALLEAGYARFFNAGAQGAAATLSLGKKWLPLPLAYSALTGLGVLAFAGLAPLLLGEEFRPSVQVLRWFAAYPVVALLHYGLDTMLTTSNRQRFVAWVMLGGAALNVVLNFWLIPILSWKGAVLSAYCSELVIVALYGSALLRARNAVPTSAS
jgi:O-antigen/teichoic acid export membrane protein